MVCVPMPTIVPAAGLCVTVTALHKSLAVAPATTFGTAAWPLLFAVAVVGAGGNPRAAKEALCSFVAAARLFLTRVRLAALCLDRQPKAQRPPPRPTNLYG